MRMQYKDSRINLIIIQISKLIELLRFRGNGGKILTAVDFSELHEYAYPDILKSIGTSKISDESYKMYAALTYLFEEYLDPDKKRYLYLLPPYRDELLETIEMFTESKSYQNYFESQARARIKYYVKLFMRDQRVWKLLEKKQSFGDKTYDNELINIIKEDYIQLYNVVSFISLKFLSRLNKFKYDTSIKIMSDAECSPFRINDIAHLKDIAEKKWLPYIKEERPATQDINNYRDAIALEYIVEINEKIRNNKEVMILITRSNIEPRPEFIESEFSGIYSTEKFYATINKNENISVNSIQELNALLKKQDLNRIIKYSRNIETLQELLADKLYFAGNEYLKNLGIGEQDDSDLKRINRILIEKAYPDITPPWPQLVSKVKTCDKECLVPLIYNPIAIFIWQAYFIHNSDGSINHEKTISNLTDLMGRFKNIINIPEFEKRIFEEELGIPEKIGDKINYIENLKIAARMRDQHTRNTLDKIIKNIYDAEDTTMKYFTDFFKRVADEIKNGLSFKNKIDNVAKSILKEIDFELNNLSTIIPFELAAQKIISTNPARLFFDETDFKDPEIKEIVKILQKQNKNKEIEEALIRLYKIQSICLWPVSKEREVNLQCWEANILVIQLKVRANYNMWALKDCDEGIKNAPEILKPLFSFLRNVIQSRYKETLIKAIKNAEHLVELYGDSHPRYNLQLGYLIWRCIQEGGTTYSHRQAMEATKRALSLAEKNKEGSSKTCYRLALANYSNDLIDEGCIEKATKTFENLSKTIGEGVFTTYIIFTQSRLFFAELCDYITSILKNKLSTADEATIDKKISKISKNISMLEKKIKSEEASDFTKKIYYDFIDDCKILMEIYRIYKDINTKNEKGKNILAPEEIVNNANTISSYKFKSYQRSTLPQDLYDYVIKKYKIDPQT